MDYPPERGQSSLEFVVTYGWVILVIVIGVLVVWKMGILKPQTEKRGTLGFSQVYVIDFSASSTTNKLKMSVKNEAGAEITIPAGRVNATIDGIACVVAPSSPVTILPGDDALISVDCSGPPSIGSIYNTGDFFKANVVINYTNTRSGRQHLSKGNVFGPVEAVT
jgi:hypothetical protein